MTDPLTQPGMVERVARALAGHFGPEFEHLPADRVAMREAIRNGEYDATVNTQEDFLEAAREAIHAMYAPTPAMIDRFVSRALCVSVHGENGWSEYARAQWATMIDAALSEQRGA